MTKTISKKLIVSTLSTVMGVSLVGAITGTVAWYQYSTRSTVSFVGTSIRSSENLQISFNKDSGYSNDKTSADTETFLTSQNKNADLLPVTTGAIAKDAALPEKFFANPIYQRFAYNNWVRADENAYVQFTIYLKLNKVENNEQPEVVESPRKVYLSDLLIQDDQNNAVADISDAVRVHLHSDEANLLLGKNNSSTNVFGALNLNGDDYDDTVETIYDFTDMTKTHIGIYGTENAVQEKFDITEVRPGVDQDGKLTGDHFLGTLFSKRVVFEDGDHFADGISYFEDADLSEPITVTDPVAGHDYYIRQDALPVTVTIWLEGWQKLNVIKSVKPAAETPLDDKDYFLDQGLSEEAPEKADGTTTYYYSDETSAMWDPLSYVAAKFDVGMMFEVDA